MAADIEATVTAVSHELGVASLSAAGGYRLAVNVQTPGVDFDSLKVGQKLTLTIEGAGIPRVLRAQS